MKVQNGHDYELERLLESIADHLKGDALVTDVHGIPDTRMVAVTLATGDRYTVSVGSLWRAPYLGAQGGGANSL